MVFQKKGDKKTDEKKIKKASLSQVVEYLNDNQEENDTKTTKTETSTKVKKTNKDKNKTDVKDKSSVKSNKKKERKNDQIVPVEGSSSHQLVHVSESSSEHLDVELVDFSEDVKDVKNSEDKDSEGKDSEDENSEDKESEEYSKKKIRQAQSAKKREERKKKSLMPKEDKKKPEKEDEEQHSKRVKRATAVEPPFDTGKKLTRKERKEMKIKNKGAGLSSKEFVRLLKEGEEKDLQDVPFEGKGIMQLPTRSKADAIAKKPLKKSKGNAAPRGRTRTAPKDKKKK